MSYYNILEVEKNADSDEIKRAFRKKSMLYHPDRPGGDIKKFQDVNAAYETLSDGSKRRHYDFEQQMQSNPFNMFGGMNGMPPMGGMPFMNMQSNIDEEDVNQLFSTLFGNIFNGNEKGPNFHVFSGSNDIPLEELFSKSPLNKKNIKPDPIVISLNITLEQSYQGCSLPVTINRWMMISDMKINEEETVYIDIYQGIDNNEIILLKEKGNISENQIKGDVKISVNIENDARFSREGLDLIYYKQLTLKESICGFSFEIEHLNNKKLAFNNKNSPTIVKPNYRKKISNMGMKRKDKTGSLIVIFEVIFPDKFDSEQIEQLKEIL